MKSRFRHIIGVVLLLLAVSYTARAQSTALRPYEGADHSYIFSGLVEGLNYEFYITANADGTGLYDDGSTGEFDFLTSPTGTIGAEESAASVQIGWNSGASLNIYYLWLELTGTNGCSNRRYVEIVPQVNAFDLLSENIPDTNTESCPSTDTDDGFDPFDPVNYTGSTTLHFLVKRENGTVDNVSPEPGDTYDWSFIPTLEVDPGLGLTSKIESITGTSSGEISPDIDGRYTVNGLDDEVIVTVSVENGPGYDRDVTLAVTQQSEERTNLSDSEPSNDEVTHTILVMPIIDGMGGI
jgi:hypothetical protein